MTTTQISPAARAAQEKARHTDGEFGTQEHTESGEVTVPAGPLDAILSSYTGMDLKTAAMFAASSNDEHTIREWAQGRLDEIGDEHITMALRLFEMHAGHEQDLLDERTPEETLAAVDQRYQWVERDAKRRSAALDAICGQSRRTGLHETTGEKFDPDMYDAAEIAKHIRADVKSAYDAGLLPAGTTVAVTTDKYSMGQSINMVLRGVPDNKVRSFMRLPEAGEVNEWTPYSKALDKVMERLVDAYNKQDVDSMTDYSHVRYYGFSRIETEHEAAWRTEQTARRKAARTPSKK